MHPALRASARPWQKTLENMRKIAQNLNKNNSNMNKIKIIKVMIILFICINWHKHNYLMEH